MTIMGRNIHTHFPSTCMSSSSSKHDLLAAAFGSAAIINEAHALREQWDRKTRAAVRREMKTLQSMMDDVLRFERDVTRDVVAGMHELLAQTEARLAGKPVLFTADADEVLAA